MPPTAKQALLAAVEDALIARPSFALVYRLAGSPAAAEVALADVSRRRRLAAPVLRYVGRLSDAQSQAVLEAAWRSPAAVHPLHAQMPNRELLAVAAIALATGAAKLSDYIPPIPPPPDY